MKTALFLFLLVSLGADAYADKNWIPIEPMNRTEMPMRKAEPDGNLSQMAQINKMVKNASVIKQLLDGTKKEELSGNSNKNWYALERMEK